MSLSKYFNGKNIITPDVLEYGKQGLLVWELSKGDFLDVPCFGVTVKHVYDEKDQGLSQMFHSESDARDYIAAGFKTTEPSCDDANGVKEEA